MAPTTELPPAPPPPPTAPKSRMTATWKKLREGIRNGSAHRAYYSMERIMGVYNTRKQHTKQILPSKEELMLKLHSVDWSLGESGDDTPQSSFCISLLQHLSKKFHHRVKMDEICYASSSLEWDEITLQLRAKLDNQNKFLAALLPLVFQKQNEQQQGSTFKEKIIHTFHQFFEFHNKIHVIDVNSQEEYMKLSNEDLCTFLNKSLQSDDILLYRDSQGVYAPIIPRRKLYPPIDGLSMYIDHLIMDLGQFQLLASCFETWLNLFISMGHDWIRLYRKSQEILEEITKCTSVDEMRVVLNGVIVTGPLYPLRFLSQVVKDLSSDERDNCVYELKKEICTALCATIKGYSLEMQQEAGMRVSEQQEIKKELEKNAELIQKQFEEETQKLKKLDNVSLEYETIKNDPTFDKLRRLYLEQSWANFKSCLLTGNPTGQLSAIKIPLDNHVKLSTLCKQLLKTFKLNPSDFPALSDRVAAESHNDLGELEKILEQLSLFETEYKDELELLTCTGTHIRLSQALVQIRNFLNQGYNVAEIHIIGSGTIWLDADVTTEVGHGRNLYILGDVIKIEKCITIDTSGHDGRPPKPKPPTPSGSGIHGGNGDRGEDGESAGNVRIESIQPIEGELTLLHIKCNGGHGGNGQDGGNGASGCNGADGEDGQISEEHPTASGVRLEFKNGKPGKNGQNGGDAGLPGVGGSGGAGGIIQIISGTETITKEPNQHEYNQQLPNLICKDGSCGRTGAAGAAGTGGDGGAHGKDRAWATESALWYYPWETYTGFLEAVYYNGWIHRGYTIKKIDPKPDATRGNRGQEKKAKEEAQKQTQSIASRKEHINSKEIRDGFKSNSQKSNQSSNTKVEEDIDAVKSEWRSETATKQTEYKKKVENTLKGVRKDIEDASKQVSRSQKEQEESLDAFQKFQELEQTISDRLDSEMSQRVSAQLRETETVSIKIDNPSDVLQHTKWGILEPEADETTNEEKAAQQLWDEYADKFVCECMDPVLQQRIRNLECRVHELGNYGLSRALDSCIQQLILHFSGSIPDPVFQTIEKLLPQHRMSVLNSEDLISILTDKLPSYTEIVYNKSNPKIEWSDLFPQTSSVAHTTSSMLDTIFLHLYTKQLDEKELEHFERALFNSIGGYNRPVFQLLLDLLEVQLLGSLKQMLQKGSGDDSEGFLNSAIAKIKGVKQAAASKMKKAMGTGRDDNDSTKFSPEEVTTFVTRVKADVFPVLRELCSEFALQFTLSKCLKHLVEHMAQENLLQLVLTGLTKIKFQHILTAMKKHEGRLDPLHRFLLPYYIQDVSQLMEFQDAVAKIDVPPRHTLTTLVEVYKHNFQNRVIEEIQQLIFEKFNENIKTCQPFKDFIELVEAKEAGLSYEKRIEFYQELTSKLRSTSSMAMNAIEIIHDYMQTVYQQVCANVLRTVEGDDDEPSDFDNEYLNADKRRYLLLKNAISKMVNKSRRTNQSPSVSQLRGIGFMLKFEDFSVDGLRIVEQEFEKLLMRMYDTTILSGSDNNEELRNTIGYIEKQFANSWNKCLKWIFNNFAERYDINLLETQKSQMIERIHSFMEMLSADQKIVNPESVTHCLLLRVELLGQLCARYGLITRMEESFKNLQNIQEWSSAADLVNILVEVLDSSIKSMSNHLNVSNDWLRHQFEVYGGDSAEKLKQQFLEVLKEPNVLKKHVDLIITFKKSNAGSETLLQSQLLDHLVLQLALKHSETDPGLVQFKSDGDVPQLSIGQLPVNKSIEGELGTLQKNIRPSKIDPSIKCFRDLVRSVYYGKSYDLRQFFVEDLEKRKLVVQAVVDGVRGWSLGHLFELAECMHVCCLHGKPKARSTLSSLRYNYLTDLTKSMLKSSVSLPFVEHLQSVEHEIWAKVGQSQLHITAAAENNAERESCVVESTWLYSFFQKILDSHKGDDDKYTTILHFTNYTLTILNQSNCTRFGAIPVVQAIRSGILQLLLEEPDTVTKSTIDALKTSWSSIHDGAVEISRVTSMDGGGSEELKNRERNLWALIHDNEKLFTKPGFNENTSVSLRFVLKRFYFRPDLSPETRELVLRVFKALKQSVAYVTELANHSCYEDTIRFLQSKGTQDDDSLRSIIYLQRLTLENKSSVELLNLAERNYLKEADKIICSGKTLAFPSNEMATECASNWARSIFAGRYVTALLSNLDLKPNPSVEARFTGITGALTQWQAAVSQKIKTNSDVNGDDQLQEWTALLTQIVKACQLSPITYAQLECVFLNASRVGDQKTVSEIIQKYTSTNWTHALYFVLLKEQFRVLYQQEEENVKATKLLECLESLEHHMRTSVGPNKYQDSLLELLLCKLYQSNRTTPDSSVIERILRQIQIQNVVDEQTVTELRPLNLGSWEDGLRTCMYRKRGVHDEKTLELCIQVEKKFRHTTEQFVNIVLKAEPDHLHKYLTHVQNGDWVLRKDIINEITQSKSKSGIDIWMNTRMEKISDLRGKDLVDAFFDLSLNADIALNLRAERLKEDLKKIDDIYLRIKSTLHNTDKLIKVWDKDDIVTWVNKVKEQRATQAPVRFCMEHKHELLAVIKRGVFTLMNQLILRDTQLLSVLCFIDSWENGEPGGRFGEIATSEGKTLITGTLAIFLSLGGLCGNIITSSPILAVNGAKELAPFFALFGVQVANVCDDTCKRGSGDSDQELRRRYGAQVIYSDIGSLQADLLRNENLGKTYAKTNRETSFMIVDEVDSMLLDKGSHVLYISHSVAELRHLKRLFIEIWKRVQAKPDRTEYAVALVTEIRAQVEAGRVPYPSFLRDFIIGRLPIWVNYAYDALVMEKNDQFVVSTKVTVVDLPTGVEQASTQYSYGLHQFLQLKYGKKLTPESLKAIFISNMGYLQHYRNNPNFKLFGLSGTLGCEQSTQLLRHLYNVDFFKMPRYKFKRCVKHDAIITPYSDVQAHLNAILTSVNIVSARQPVLIICENVKDAQAGEAHFKEPWKGKGRLFAYTSGNQDDVFTSTFTRENPCRPGDVIFSTNLAGRGTDLPIDTSEACDGLHVILATIPPNERVEKQAFGRTSRAGKKGSTQYIVRELPGYAGTHPHTIQGYQRAMSQLEAARLRQIRIAQVPQIRLEEELFHKFTLAYNSLMDDNDVWSKPRGGERRACTEGVKKIYGELVRNEWAFWLDSVQTQVQAVHLTGPKPLYDQFNTFWKRILQKAKQQWELCMSAADYVKLARAHEQDSNVELAVATLLRAIRMEPYYNEIAHYYLGVCLLKLDARKKNFATRWLARHHLKIARAGIERNCQNLVTMKNDIGFAQFGATMEATAAGGAEPPSKQKDILLEVQFKNEQDLYERHLRILEDLLGTRIDQHFFACLSGIDRDLEEAKEVFQALLKADSTTAVINDRVFKPMRLSRKICLVDGDKLTFEGKLLEWPVQLADYVLGLEASVRTILRRKTQSNSEGDGNPVAKVTKLQATVPMCYNFWDTKGMSSHIDDKILTRTSDTWRYLDSEDFKHVLVTKEVLWKKLKDIGFIQEKDKVLYSWIVNFDEEIYRNLELPSMETQDTILVGRLLSSHNFQRYERDMFKALLDNQIALKWETVEEVLKKIGILYCQIDFEGTIADTYYTGPDAMKVEWVEEEKLCKLRGLPDTLKPYINLLEHMLIERDPETGAQVVGLPLRTVTTRSLSSITSYSPKGQENTRELILRELQQIGIIKPVTVNWDLLERFGNEKAREKQIKQCLKKEDHEMKVAVHTIFKKRHTIESDNDFKCYLKNMRHGLIRSVGSVKTFDYLSIPSPEYDTIDRAYAQSDKSVQLPTSNLEELVEFYGADFERIPQIKRYISWWCNGATYAALFGAAQIALGITLAFATGGVALFLAPILISEGGSDIMFAIQSGLSGSFSWKSYALHKTISVAFSIATGGIAGATGVTNVATRIGMEVVEEIFKKTLWTIGRYAAEGLASSFASMGIEKVLDSIRLQVLSRFRQELKIFFCSSENFRNAITALRTALGKLYAASYQKLQAEERIKASFEAMKEKVGPYAHALATVMRTLSRYVVDKICQQVVKYSGRYGWALSAGNALLRFLGLTSILTKEKLASIFNFATNQVQKLVGHFEEDAQKLKARASVSYSTHEKSSPEEYDKFVTKYMDQLENQLVEDTVAKLQQDLFEPALKEFAHRQLSRGFDRMFKERQLQFDRQLSDAGMRASLGRFMDDSGLKTALRHEQVRRDVTHPRNNVWNLDPSALVSGCGQTVGDLLGVFGISVILIQHSQNLLPLAATATIKSTTVAVFVLDKSTEHLRELAIEAGLPIIRRIQLI